MITAVTSNNFSPCYLVDLTLADGTVAHAWSGFGSIAWNGNTYAGIGSLGAVGDVEEGSEVKADGTTIALSGIDATLLSDTLGNIQVGAPATVWLGLFASGAISSAYVLFAGAVDKPQIEPGPDTFSIALALETKMSNLQRAGNRRYTAADQRRYYSDDSGFNWVEVLNDIALLWG